jgi:hypothetical protein
VHQRSSPSSRAVISQMALGTGLRAAARSGRSFSRPQHRSGSAPFP